MSAASPNQTLFFFKNNYYIKKKARESVPVTRPALQGLRIAQSSLNEQRRSPRRYV